MAPVQYDLIVDNPWEHPEELKDTLRLVAALKPPYTFAINALTLLPGTTIYDMGESAGFTKKDEKITLASYVTYMATELNLTLAFYNIAPVPKFWLKRVLAKRLRRTHGDDETVSAIGSADQRPGAYQEDFAWPLCAGISRRFRGLSTCWLGGPCGLERLGG